MEILGARESLFFCTSSFIFFMLAAFKTITAQRTTLRLRLATTISYTLTAVRCSGRRKLLLSLSLCALLLFGLRAKGQSLGEWRPSEISGFHYPMLARTAGIEGTVTVDCDVDLDGTVSNVVVVSGNGLLNATAVSAARTWRFKWSGDTPKKGKFKLTFEFHLGKRLKSSACPEESEKLTFEYPNVIKLVSDRPPVEVESSKTKS